MELMSLLAGQEWKQTSMQSSLVDTAGEEGGASWEQHWNLYTIVWETHS